MEEYSVIVMEKIVIDEIRNIFIFKPIDVISGVIHNEQFIDVNGNYHTLITDKNICDINMNNAIAFPIENKKLIHSLPGYTLKHAQDAYLFAMKDFLNIAFDIKDLDKIGLMTFNLSDLFENVYNKMTDLKENGFITVIDQETKQPKGKISVEEGFDWIIQYVLILTQEILESNDLIQIKETILELKECMLDLMEELKNGNKDDLKRLPAPKKEGRSMDVDYDRKQYELDQVFNGFNEENFRTRIKPHLEELDNLVGLDTIKEEINKLVNYILYREKTKEYLNFEDLNLNMVFTGNPGTGKTTVAGILSQLLYELGYLKNPTVAYITAEKLIAGYVGQTAIKTRKLLDENKGGVIVVDEAYVLASESQNFGPEAIAEILKDMEKRETAFIFAGYEKEMEAFINMNSGLTSRLGIKMHFPDYSFEQLHQMLLNKVIKMNKNLTSKHTLHFTKEAEELVKKLIKEASLEKDFGNARFVNNLADSILREKANSIESCQNIEDLLTIYPENIPVSQYEKEKPKTKKIGFQL